MKKAIKWPVLGVVFVILLAILFRFFKLSDFPVSLSMDETAFGYNAYSILKTGRDEWGQFLPLAFKSVGDYKPPVDVYLMVPSAAIFGLTDFSERLPMALMGVGTVIAFIFLVRQFGMGWKSAIFTGVWLAVLPWHVYYSRGGVGASSSLFFMVFGALMFLVWTSKQKLWNLILSVISFSLSVWAYHSERIFVPLLVIFLIFMYRNKFNLKKSATVKQLIISSIILLVFVTPFLVLTFFSPAIAERAASTSILREASLVSALHSTYSDFTQAIFDNNLYLILRHWAGKYFNYFDIRFWFWNGLQITPPAYPGSGLLYFADLPVFIYGIYSLIKSKNENLKKISLFWLFTGPLAASFTMNEQHPLRALTWLPFFGFVIASAAENFFTTVKKTWVLIVYLIFLIINIVYFGDMYFNQFPRFYAESWQYGYKQLSEYACANLGNYDKILISNTFGSEGPTNSGVPYLYMLFYCPEDRNSFIKTGKHLDKIQFTRPNIYSTEQKGKLLLIGSPWDFLQGYYGGKMVGEVDYPSGIPAFIFVSR